MDVLEVAGVSQMTKYIVRVIYSTMALHMGVGFEVKGIFMMILLTFME